MEIHAVTYWLKLLCWPNCKLNKFSSNVHFFSFGQLLLSLVANCSLLTGRWVGIRPHAALTLQSLLTFWYRPHVQIWNLAVSKRTGNQPRGFRTGSRKPMGDIPMTPPTLTYSQWWVGGDELILNFSEAVPLEFLCTIVQKNYEAGNRNYFLLEAFTQILVGSVSVCCTVTVIKTKKKTTDSHLQGRKKHPHT